MSRTPTWDPTPRTVVLLALVSSLACGGEPATPETPTETHAREPAAENASPNASPNAPPAENAASPTVPQPPPPGTTAEVSPASPTPTSPEVDLLHTVPTEVAASSAYRDRASEVAKLFDGDLSTAYNSATDALVGTYVEIRVPEGARVTGVELTVGFTNRQEGVDLFTGNHRVTSVRISREGAELTTQSLDPESRELQRVAVSGGPGVYRVEVAGVLPGSNPAWREACISELRLLGHAADAIEGSRFPLYAIGALPTRPLLTPPAREGFDEVHRRFLHGFASDWASFEGRFLADQHLNTGIDFPEVAGAARRRREQLLQRLHDFVAPIDAAAGDRIRGALARVMDDWSAFEPDLAIVTSALDVVATWSGEASVRCRTDQLTAQMWMRRVSALLAGEAMVDEMNYLDETIDSGPDVTALAEAMAELYRTFSRSPSSVARRVLAKQLPRTNLESIPPSWEQMRGALTRAQTTCAWGAE